MIWTRRKVVQVEGAAGRVRFYHPACARRRFDGRLPHFCQRVPLRRELRGQEVCVECHGLLGERPVKERAAVPLRTALAVVAASTVLGAAVGFAGGTLSIRCPESVAERSE